MVLLEGFKQDGVAYHSPSHAQAFRFFSGHEIAVPQEKSYSS
jgi:hypothetical protein